MVAAALGEAWVVSHVLGEGAAPQLLGASPILVPGRWLALAIPAVAAVYVAAERAVSPDVADAWFEGEVDVVRAILLVTPLLVELSFAAFALLLLPDAVAPARSAPLTPA